MRRGIWYEKRRNRYRVRLYRQGRVIYRSYHRTHDEAVEAFRRAKEAQAWIREHDHRPLLRIEDRIAALASQLI